MKYRSKWKYPLIDVNKETGYRNAVDSINTAKQGFQETVNNVNGDFEKDLKSNE